MWDQKHRPGIQEGFLVTRKLKVQGLSDQDKATIIDEIDRLGGVDKIPTIDENDLLVVSYDGSRLGVDDLERVIVAHGGRLADDWWSRMKLRSYRSTDLNLKDNAVHVPSCCSKPPR